MVIFSGQSITGAFIILNITKLLNGMRKRCHTSQQENQENPSDILQYKELQARIASILERLPERCGKIFYMNRFEGLKYTEIAEKLSVSVKTVESNMGRHLKNSEKN